MGNLTFITLAMWVYHKMPELKAEGGISMKHTENLGIPMFSGCVSCGARLGLAQACIGRDGFIVGTCCASQETVCTSIDAADQIMSPSLADQFDAMEAQQEKAEERLNDDRYESEEITGGDR